MSSLPDYDTMPDSPETLAWRIAGYKRDPHYIEAYCRREYGRAPKLSAIQRMIEDRHRPRRVSHIEREMDRKERERDERRAKQEAKDEAQRKQAAEERRQRIEDGQTAYERLRSHQSPAGRIIAAVAYAFTITPAALVGKCKTTRHVLARQVVIRLLRNRRNEDNTFVYSTPMIGKILGGRDHSTVVHALNTFDVAMAYHPYAKEIYDRFVDYLS